jgi:hypothetical protein
MMCMADLRISSLHGLARPVYCSAQRLETLTTERNRKDKDMTAATTAQSATGLLAGAERPIDTLRQAWAEPRARLRRDTLARGAREAVRGR